MLLRNVPGLELLEEQEEQGQEEERLVAGEKSLAGESQGRVTSSPICVCWLRFSALQAKKRRKQEAKKEKARQEVEQDQAPFCFFVFLFSFFFIFSQLL